MKKILFIIIAVFAFSFAKAQDIHFGAKAGVNFAKMTSSESDFNKLMTGRTAFHVGAVVEFTFSDKFSLQPEVLYNSVGGTFDFSSSVTRAEEDTTVDWISDYLSIPVMAKYYVADGFSLEAGPQVGFLLGAKMKNSTDEEDMKDEMESTDFGLGFGAGYKMENGLFFDARYSLGLSNIFKDVEDGQWGRNNAIQISVGFMFN